MNIVKLVYDSTGRVLGTIDYDTDLPPFAHLEAGQSALDIVPPLTFDPYDVYVKNRTIIPIPARPEGVLAPRFNFATEEWEEDTEELKNAAVGKRDWLLASSDYTQLADAPMTGGMKQKWAIYRKKLRDVPEQPGFPRDISWPEPPA